MVTKTVEKRKIVEEAVKVISSSEGKYNTVVTNDNGACSIGLLQWHGERALILMKSIAAKTAKIKLMSDLGPLLALEITNPKTSWKTRKLTVQERNKIARFISSPIGRKVQDEMAYNDVERYVDKAISLGIKNAGAIIYFADAFNQYGINSKLWIALAGIASKMVNLTVETLHQLVEKDATLSKYLAHRKNTLTKVSNSSISDCVVK